MRVFLLPAVVVATIASWTVGSPEVHAAAGCASSATEASMLIEASRAAGKDSASLESVREVMALGHDVIAEAQVVLQKIVAAGGTPSGTPTREAYTQLEPLGRALEAQAAFMHTVILRARKSAPPDHQATVVEFLKFLSQAGTVQISESARESFSSYFNYWYSGLRGESRFAEVDGPFLHDALFPYSIPGERAPAPRPAIERLATHMAKSESWARHVSTRLAEARSALSISWKPELSGSKPPRVEDARRAVAGVLEIVDRYVGTRDAAATGTGTDAFYISEHYRKHIGRWIEATSKHISEAAHLPPEIRTELTTSLGGTLSRLRASETDARDARLEWE